MMDFFYFKKHQLDDTHYSHCKYRVGNLVWVEPGRKLDEIRLLETELCGVAQNRFTFINKVILSNTESFLMNKLIEDIYPIYINEDSLELLNIKVDSLNDLDFLIPLPNLSQYYLQYVEGSQFIPSKYNILKKIENGNTLIYDKQLNSPIKYIHQLQNFYFSITGEELLK